MRIQDGKYDIISRKYGVSLGAEALSSPVILLVYRVAAQQSGIPWEIEASADSTADADSKVISFTAKERTLGGDPSPEQDSLSAVKSTTYRCPDTSTAKAKNDRCTTWAIREAKTATGPALETTYYTISDSEGKLWKLKGGAPGSEVSIEALGPDEDPSAYHFEFKRIKGSV